MPRKCRRQGQAESASPERDETAGGEEKPHQPAANLPPKAVLDALPEHARASVVEAASFSGPLPPPSMYGEYDRVLPGSADRILSMAEKEQSHRISTENEALAASVKDSKLGQYFGFALATLCLGGGVYLAINGHTVVPVVLVCASAIGLVNRFLDNRASR